LRFIPALGHNLVTLPENERTVSNVARLLASIDCQLD
jgi:hypothetical protein